MSLCILCDQTKYCMEWHFPVCFDLHSPALFLVPTKEASWEYINDVWCLTLPWMDPNTLAKAPSHAWMRRAHLELFTRCTDMVQTWQGERCCVCSMRTPDRVCLQFPEITRCRRILSTVPNIEVICSVFDSMPLVSPFVLNLSIDTTVKELKDICASEGGSEAYPGQMEKIMLFREEGSVPMTHLAASLRFYLWDLVSGDTLSVNFHLVLTSSFRKCPRVSTGQAVR